jgi:hypothetical protein
MSHTHQRVCVVVGSLEPFLLRTKPLHAKEGKAANQCQHTGTATTQPIVLITLHSLFHPAPKDDALCPALLLLLSPATCLFSAALAALPAGRSGMGAWPTRSDSHILPWQ